MSRVTAAWRSGTWPPKCSPKFTGRPPEMARSAVVLAVAALAGAAVMPSSGSTSTSAARVVACGKDGKTYLTPNPSGGYALVLYKLRVRGLTCRTGGKIAGRQITGRSTTPWRCTVAASSRVTCRKGQRLVRYTADGSAS